LTLVLPISKRRQEDKVFFDEQGGKVKILSPKTVHTLIFIRNLSSAKIAIDSLGVGHCCGFTNTAKPVNDFQNLWAVRMTVSFL